MRTSLSWIVSLAVVVDGFVTAPPGGNEGRLSCASSALRYRDNGDDDSSLALGGGTAVLPARHVRWYPAPTEKEFSTDNAWALQTAVTTWKHPTTGHTVELHAMVHFGEESYYQVYNDPAFSDNRTVLYELLVDENILTTSEDDDRSYCRRVAEPLGASVTDQQTAARYGWKCQVNVLDYQQPTWRHADWTRQEFQRAMQQQQQSKTDIDVDRPVWQHEATSPSAAAEAATALLVGPPTMMVNQDSRRRLFSNLFLPGSTLAQALRLALWMTVPAPECSVLLLDWASTTTTTTSRRSSNNSWQASWSPIVRFLLQAVWSARLDVVQRLAFGQVLLTGSRPTQPRRDGDGVVAQSLLIRGRNQRALHVLDQTLQEHDNDPQTVSLLYGSSHCADLSQSLRQRGFVPQSTSWRTAWSVQLDDTPSAAAPWWLVPATLYLAASGADWLATWHAIVVESGSSQEDPGQVALLAAAYGVRHVLLYLGLSKVVLDWQPTGGVE